MPPAVGRRGEKGTGQSGDRDAGGAGVLPAPRNSAFCLVSGRRDVTSAPSDPDPGSPPGENGSLSHRLFLFAESDGCVLLSGKKKTRY